MKYKVCAVLLALLLTVSLTACRFTFELGGIEGGVHLELPQKTAVFCQKPSGGMAL